MSKSIFNFGNIKPILRGRIPGQLIVQFTDYCNATCPQCSMRKTEPFQRSTLQKAELMRIIDAAAKQQIQAISFTGGEPFLFENDLIEMLQYASDRGIPFTRTGTNGFMFRDWESPEFEDRINRLAERLAQTNLRNFWISIDSADPAVHEEMRGLPGVIKGIEKALPIFHRHGIYPAANLGINRNTGGAGKIPLQMSDPEEFYWYFRAAFATFYDFVIDLGFTMVNACYPMSVDGGEGGQEDGTSNAVYGASSTDVIVKFTIEEKIQIFKALMDTIPEYRPHIRIFTPLVSLDSLIRQYEGSLEFPLPCRGGIDFFFVDANHGNTYPCGFRGAENLGKFYDLDLSKIKSQPFCVDCDWECFRDPSELIGHLIALLQTPLQEIHRKDAAYQQMWKQDLHYYKQCDYFDGRLPMR